MTERSAMPNIRNPLLQLDAVRQLQSLPPESKSALQALLLDLRRDAQARATQSWKKNKAPMAAYWKAVAVYAGHAARLLRDVEVTP